VQRFTSNFSLHCWVVMHVHMTEKCHFVRKEAKTSEKVHSLKEVQNCILLPGL
jgi:hypothetical protein